ncbi:MAG: hypothetical protein JXR96_11775 [Deltaproteobacteria bacterium]|nr:hypothetical protein [Deltaproteobacteria bacterium]
MCRSAIALSTALGLMLLSTGAAAQTPLTIIVHAPSEGGKLSASVISTMVQRWLMKQGRPHWTFFDLDELAGQAKNTADKMMLADVRRSAGLHIRAGSVVCEGDQCSFRASLVDASGKAVGMAIGTAPKPMQAVEAAIPKLVEAIERFEARRAEQGSALRVELREAPRRMVFELRKVLKRQCSRVENQMASRSQTVFSVRCKADPIELAAALEAAIGDEEHRFLAKTRGLIVIQFGK